MDNMSQVQTSFRTITTPKPSAHGTIPTPEFNTSHSSTRRPASRTHQPHRHSHSEHKTCCMHVHQQPSQTSRLGEPLSLREVKHPHTGTTYMNRSPLTEQAVLSQFSGDSDEIGHSTRDPCTTQPKSCTEPTIHAPNNQEIHTCINCEHSHGHMNDQNTPDFLGKQFLQGKEEKITCTDMENTPALQYNETSMVNTCAFMPGSTPSRHSTISTSTHTRKVTPNFQLEKESSNMMALPGFKRSAEIATHVETSRNAHNNVSICDNMDTNHTAHRPLPSMAHQYRFTKKEVHLLSGPPELRPLKEMAHRYRHTRKEAHLLSGPSELRPTEDPENSEV